jgi:hypothetical protein
MEAKMERAACLIQGLYCVGNMLNNAFGFEAGLHIPVSLKNKGALASDSGNFLV